MIPALALVPGQSGVCVSINTVPQGSSWEPCWWACVRPNRPCILASGRGSLSSLLLHRLDSSPLITVSSFTTTWVWQRLVMF